MNIRFSLPSLALLAFAVTPSTASADEFWFSLPPEGAAAVEGSVPDMIEGVLLREENGYYVIRIVGGEVRVKPEQVVRRVATDLTVDAIADQERADDERLAQANVVRREMLAIEANAQAQRFAAEAAARAEEASARRDARVSSTAEAAFGLLQGAPVQSYDPVLHRVVQIPGGSFVLQNILKQEYGGYIRNALRDLRDRFR